MTECCSEVAVAKCCEVIAAEKVSVVFLMEQAEEAAAKSVQQGKSALCS